MRSTKTIGCNSVITVESGPGVSVLLAVTLQLLEPSETPVSHVEGLNHTPINEC